MIQWECDMKHFKRISIGLMAFLCHLNGVDLTDLDLGYAYDDNTEAFPFDERPCEEACKDYWCRYIVYEPMYYTVQKAIERQVPTKKKCCRLVPREYVVQRVRYIPETYNETIVKNEVEYYYVDDWKTSTEMIVEQKCEWVPKVYWKKVSEGLSDMEYTEEMAECGAQQDE